MGDTLVIAVRVVVSLAVVFGVLLFLTRKFTKGRSRSSSDSLAVVGRQTVGGKSSVVVVELDGRRFLLGVTEQNISVLHTGDVAPAVTPDAAFAYEMAGALAAVEPLEESDRPSLAAPEAQLASPPIPTRLKVREPPRAAVGSAPVTWLDPRRAPAPATGPLGNSILSSATWKQAAVALRRAR